MKNRIRDLRKAAGMTMKQLGAIIGVAESTVSQYETGKREPDFETLLMLGEYFGVTVDYILGNDPVEPDLAEYLTDLRDRPETRALLEASRGMTKAQVEAMADMIKSFKGESD